MCYELYYAIDINLSLTTFRPALSGFPECVMAITDISLADIHASPHVRAEIPASATAPAHALARLSEIHAETFETVQLDRFLRSASRACALLMLLGVLAVAVAGGASL